jgi:hypothetical protein
MQAMAACSLCQMPCQIIRLRRWAWNIGRRESVSGISTFSGGRKYWYFMRNEADASGSAAMTVRCGGTGTSLDRARHGLPWPPRLLTSSSAFRSMPNRRHAHIRHGTHHPAGRCCTRDGAQSGAGGVSGDRGCSGAGRCGARSGVPDAVLPLYQRMRLKRVRQFVSGSRGKAAWSRIGCRAGRWRLRGSSCARYSVRSLRSRFAGSIACPIMRSRYERHQRSSPS